jgi:iron complex transport system substrate-binding protein
MSTTDTLPRIASLLPSATEMVCALGAETELVGVSHECDWPPGVSTRSILTSSKVITRGTSGAIDRDVRRILRAALAVYDIDLEALRRAAPNVIVTQDLCDVCAVSFEDVVLAAREIVPDARIVNLHPTRLAEIWDDIAKVAAALGREAVAERVLRALQARVEAIRVRAAALATRPRVLTIEWIDPVMIGGTWMPELVALAGGEPLVTRAGDHAPTLSPTELASLDPAPDVVLIKPCGFKLERTLAERDTLHELLGTPGIAAWPATRRGALWVADGNAYFNRPGPRIVESLEILAACVHPEAFGDFARLHAASFVRFDPRAARAPS